ncbi:hypothetical protein GCM10008959_16300 [Deinococcus seoulensis]|uniref:Uncharacterized protein n=1 Tax=Deinococcus seoulensis TaxID=1837379 RepID=A0ABQ2RRK5_9DEIO|nr:hypothetical protein GCM10008959_16300 [Deinococcus seoulensis]
MCLTVAATAERAGTPAVERAGRGLYQTPVIRSVKTVRMSFCASHSDFTRAVTVLTYYPLMPHSGRAWSARRTVAGLNPTEVSE